MNFVLGPRFFLNYSCFLDEMCAAALSPDATASRVPGTAVVDQTATDFWHRDFREFKSLHKAQPWVEPEKPLIEKPHIRKQGEES